MPLLITSIRDDSVLKPHGVQVGDYLAHINAWSVRTKSNAKIAYKTDDLDLAFQRDSKAYEIQLVAEDLGITVEDEDGEVFDVSINQLANANSPANSSGPVSTGQRIDAQEGAPVAGAILKVIAWVFFVLTALGSIMLLSEAAVIETPGRYGTSTSQLNGEIIALVVISLMSSVFFLALSYLLSHMQEQLQLVRRELGSISKQLSK